MTVITRRCALSAMIIGIGSMAAALAWAPQSVRRLTESLLWEQATGPFYSRAVLWDATAINEPRLRSYYQRIRGDLTTRHGWTVRVFSDQSDATRELYGKMVAESDYDWWLKLYNQFGRDMLPMAEIAGYGDNAVLRLRDASGKLSEAVLSGRNFLHVTLGGLRFEILKLAFDPPAPVDERGTGNRAVVRVYARFSQVEQATRPGSLESFGKYAQGLFGQEQTVVALRRDAFFITDNRFPIVYRFDELSRPPSREEYDRSSTVYCFCDEDGVVCR